MSYENARPRGDSKIRRSNSFSVRSQQSIVMRWRSTRAELGQEEEIGMFDRYQALHQATVLEGTVSLQFIVLRDCIIVIVSGGTEGTLAGRDCIWP